MSGIKCAEIIMDDIADFLLRTKQEKDRAGEGIKNCLHKSDQLKSEISRTRLSSDFKNRLQSHFELLEEEENKLKKSLTEIQDMTLPEMALDIDLKALTKTREDICNYIRSNEKLEEKFYEIQRDLISLKNTNDRYNSIKYSTVKIQDKLNKYNDLLLKWEPKLFAKINQNYDQLQKRLAEENYYGLEDSFKEIDTQIDEAYKKAAEKHELNQKRLYIIKGVRQICASLGFEEQTSPAYEKEDNPASCVNMVFDTLNNGLITFSFHLDNSVTTESGMLAEPCDNQFHQISEMLSENFGMKAEFKHEDGTPLRKLNRAKSMPTQGPNKRRAYEH